MARDQELDRIKSEEQAAFQRKQAAWAVWDEARSRADDAYDAMQSAWDERVDAKEEMNHEYELMQASSEHYREVWDDYGRIRDANNAQIDSLRNEADSEHHEMQRCFDQASHEYEYGDKSMAPVYSQEGHEHKARRDELNAEVSRLCREVKEARQNAEWRAPKTDSSAFKAAQEKFHQAKARHEAAQAEFKRLKAERDRTKSEFRSAQAEHKRLKEAFQQRLEEVKAAKRTRNQQAVDKVNMALVRSNAHYLGTLFGQDAKIVPRNDGKTDVYFGGLNPAGDGLGHGHAVIDENGNVAYLRDAWVADPKNDYLIDDRADRRGKDTHRI